MKVWEARLTLGSTGKEWLVFFDFECDEKDYVLNQYYYCESKRGWAFNRIPVQMEIEGEYGNLSVVQGFDHELTEEELSQLREAMKQVLIQKIERDREAYLKTCQQKIEILTQF